MIIYSVVIFFIISCNILSPHFPIKLVSVLKEDAKEMKDCLRAPFQLLLGFSISFSLTLFSTIFQMVEIPDSGSSPSMNWVLQSYLVFVNGFLFIQLFLNQMVWWTWIWNRIPKRWSFLPIIIKFLMEYKWDPFSFLLGKFLYRKLAHSIFKLFASSKSLVANTTNWTVFY